MYEQYVMIEKRLLNNKSRLVIVKRTKIDIKNMNMSPSFDNVMQGSDKMSDIEAHPYIFCKLKKLNY